MKPSQMVRVELFCTLWMINDQFKPNKIHVKQRQSRAEGGKVLLQHTKESLCLQHAGLQSSTHSYTGLSWM